MNAEELSKIFNADAASAISPLVAITGGIVLLLVADMFDSLARFRKAIFLGTLIVATICEFTHLGSGPGTVLANSFTADSATAMWGFLFIVSTALAWSYSQTYYTHERRFMAEHDVLMLTSTLGMMMMAGAQDLIVFFVGLELLSVPLYALAGFRRTRDDSVEAGLKYFVLGAFASALFLYGAALLYAGTGEVSFAGFKEVAATSPLALAGIGLITASVLFKIAAFPFHMWVPDVYQGSATPVTTFMATSTKAAAFAFLLNAAFLLPESAARLISVVAVLTMVVGNLAALMQTNLKRMLAYSSIAHGGTMLLAIAGQLAGDPEPDGALHAVLFYMAAYVFTTGGAFGIISMLEADGERFTELKSLKGLAKRRPGVAAAMLIFMLSLGGIPFTAGFLGKWFVFSVAIRAGLVIPAIIGIVTSVVALGYYLRVIITIYMEDAPSSQAAPTARPLSVMVPAGICAVMVLVLGVLPGWFLKLL